MTKLDIKNYYDVVIVGARCAGAATAMLLSRMGARVLVVDQSPAGSDTLSTHALMRGAVMQLNNWGLLPQIAASGAPAIHRTSFIYGDDQPIDIDLRPSYGVNALYAPRRMVLDTVIADAAEKAGATIRFGVKCTDLLRAPDGSVRGVVLRDSSGETHEVASELVIGADGRQSIVAQLVGASTLKQSTHSTKCIYGYYSGLCDAGYRWHYGQHCAGGIIPTNNNQSCVFLSLPSHLDPSVAKLTKPKQFADFVEHFMPQFAKDIGGGKIEGRLVGFAGQAGYLRRSCGNGWALVGDAGYFKDPITAHGITDALRDAQILAESWADCRLDDYVATRDALSHDMLRITDAIASYKSTIPQLMELHQDLNQAMKSNQDWIANKLIPMKMAA